MSATEYDWFKYLKQRDKIAKRLNDTVHCIHSSSMGRRASEERHLRLYSEREFRSKWGRMSPHDVAVQRMKDLKRPGAPLNLIRNGVNAAVSMVCRGRPMPFFVTDGSDWKLQRQTRKRHRFVNGILHREQHQLLGQAMAQQGSIFGSGFIHVLRTKHGPRLESVFTPEILVDEAEAQYGCPPNVYRVRAMDRDVLKAMIPKAKKEIEDAPASSISGSGSTSNMVDVIYGWHMANDEEDGVEAACIDGGQYLLYAKPYKHKHPPFIKWDWNREPLGWMGTGIPSEGAAIQFMVNALLLMIDHNVWSGGNLKVLVERGAKIVKSHLSNSLRAPIIEYTGTKPDFSVPATVNGDVMELAKWYANQFYEQIGISRMNATSMTPAASMSGKARLVHENSESQRFLTTQRSFDHSMTIDTAERILEAAEDCYEEYGDIEVMYAGSHSVEPVCYSDIIGDKKSTGSFNIECFTASGLSNSVMGRFDEVQTYAQAGYYTPEEVMLLLDLPSTGAAADDRRAIFENIEVRLGRIMDDNIYIPPDDTLPLQLALKRANVWLSRAEVMSYNPNSKRRIPKENLSSLREWRDDVVNLIELQNQPAQAPVAADSGAVLPSSDASAGGTAGPAPISIAA